ncbi:MAG: T9SS type A sorting domain-containing protein [Hymenobacter sp.]|nr:MAG: T9SS type A sorting domain-containing protein [Hymenobacter sp.]
MKHFFTGCMLVGAAAAHAQNPITITAAQYPATAASVVRYQAAAVSGVAVPTKGANQTWDYRGLVAQGSAVASTYASAGTAPPFVGSVRSYALPLALGPFSINATSYEGFDAVGFSQLGLAVPAQSFPLTATTGGPTDALSVPTQNILVNLLRTPLPLTSTTRVVRQSRVVSNATLSVLLLGLSQAPFRYVQRITTVDSVAGWGTVRIPVAGAAGGSAPIPVLLMQRRVAQQDSFYLNNQPAPAILLAALGQTQGNVSYDFQQSFYRQNASQDVLSFGYSNSSFSTLTAARYSAETAIPLAATAAREVATGGLTAWPNPAGCGQAVRFALAAVAPGQALRLTLRDATGRVAASLLAPNGGSTSLPALPAGLYLAEAEAADGTRASRRVVVEQ